MKRLLLAILVASTLTLCACAPMGGRGPANNQPGGERDERGGGGPSVVANLQERLRQTAEALQLKPTQLPLWDRYEEKSRCPDE